MSIPANPSRRDGSAPQMIFVERHVPELFRQRELGAASQEDHHCGGAESYPGRVNIMPWAFFRNLTDDDLKAMFAYLQILKPIKHRVENTEPPTYRKLSQHKHGFGAMN